MSSTAIYNGLEGHVDEESSLNMATEKVQILNAAEQAVLNFSKLFSTQFSKQSPKQLPKQLSKQGTVIRLAGLVGPERHPGKFILANKTLSNATALINLIHQQDAVGLIESLLQAKYSQGIFNGVSDTHVSKQQYYQVAAKALKLEPPVFAQQHTNNTTRVVSGEKAKKVLSYNFIYPDLLTWL